MDASRFICFELTGSGSHRDGAAVASECRADWQFPQSVEASMEHFVHPLARLACRA